MAYNAVVEADGRPGWRLDPATALAAPSPHQGGDLARLLGVQDSVTEEAEELALPQGEKTLLTADPYGDYVQTSGRPGPTIMIIGNSFTGAHIEPMLLAACRARRLARVEALRLRLGGDRPVPA